MRTEKGLMRLSLALTSICSVHIHGRVTGRMYMCERAGNCLEYRLHLTRIMYHLVKPVVTASDLQTP